VATQLKVRVFTGPSRPATLVPEIDWVPPASAGELRAATEEGVRRMILADTLFLDAAPSHREILDVIKSGVEIIGCASAGALRAVELAGHGMKGAGLVFALYRDGLINEDAEIACILDTDYRALAPSLLELRMIFGRLCSETAEERAVQCAFRDIAQIYFMRRDCDTLKRIAAKYLSMATSDRLDSYIGHQDHRLKARDIARVAKTVADCAKLDGNLETLPPDQEAWLARGLSL
jgi:hypothetical protein